MNILVAFIAIFILILSNSFFSDIFVFLPVDIFGLIQLAQGYIWLGVLLLFVIWVIGE
ncbi:MAG: hypothetical protein N5P05_003979 [Chroococcopsis gigantea SAG 12.99]|jgi:hypothetical protein|nr:hypothetical protein [Chroococcopsis gigantea SAG 12.99]